MLAVPTGPQRSRHLRQHLCRALALGLITGCTLLGPIIPTAQAQSSFAHTIAVLRAFVDAYDRHDLNAVMAFFLPKPLQYGDCDFATLDGTNAVGNDSMISMAQRIRNLRAWFRARFAENDRFEIVQLVAANPEEPYVGGIEATRSSDVLDELGLSPHFVNSKWVTDQAGLDLMPFGVWSSYNECTQRPQLGQGLPAVASIRYTRAVVRAFIDAYNAHLTDRILQLMTQHVKYRDCDLAHHQTRGLAGRAQLRNWLHSRFHAGDQLLQATIVTGQPAAPTHATINAIRPSPLGESAVRLTIRTGPDGHGRELIQSLGCRFSTATS